MGKYRINDLLAKAVEVINSFKIDAISERTSGSGVTVDGVLLKDNAVTASGGFVGNVTGAIKSAPTAVTANGAIAVPLVNTTYYITKAGVAALTLVDPTATTHDDVTLTFMSFTANAHTLSNAAGSGFNVGGAAKDIGTFGGAIGDNIVIKAYQGKWVVVSSVNVTLA